ETLIALTRLVKRIEIHDQVELVVRAVRDPRECVCVVGARLVENRQRLAMTRSASLRHRECANREKSTGQSAHGERVHTFSFVLGSVRSLCDRSTRRDEERSYEVRGCA